MIDTVASAVWLSQERVSSQAVEANLPMPGALNAGEYHTCAVTSEGDVRYWGDNRWSQAAPPSGRFTQVSAGWSYTCGLMVGGEVHCWGINEVGQADPPGGAFTRSAPAIDIAARWMSTVWWWYLTDPPQDVKFGLTQPEQSGAADQSDESAHLTVRIIARRVPDGRIEFGLRSPNGDLFPSARYFPTLGPGHEGWLRSQRD